jgi:hypothetical protein
MTVLTEKHAHVGLANPFLICDECKKRVPYWHNPDRCGCDEVFYNYPCGHSTVTTSICPTWAPAYGCICDNGCKVPE